MRRGRLAAATAIVMILASAAGTVLAQAPPETGLAGLEDVPAAAAVSGEDKQIDEVLKSMTIEEKIWQMFVVTPESLTGVDTVTVAGDISRSAVRERPVGGLVFFEPNLIDEGQISSMLAGMQQFSLERIGLPMFLCVDEEGGDVQRIGGRIAGSDYVPPMSEIGASGDTDRARECGEAIGLKLAALGFNVDFAPCADVLTNPANEVVRTRSFGSDPARCADMAAAFMEGLHRFGIMSALKHFPGHGSTSLDSHNGNALSEHTMAQLEELDLPPFIAGIKKGTEMIMTGHISFPNASMENVPASLSPELVDGVLRQRLGYDGIVITDALNMGAITANYSSAEAAVKAVEAGSDLLLMPVDLNAAYQGLLDAVLSGRIGEERINESLRRIIRLKLALPGQSSR